LTSNARIDWRGVVAGLLTGSLVVLVGYFLLRNQRGEMGTTLFFLVPVAAGFAAGLISTGRTVLVLALFFTFIVSTAFLVMFKAEGWVCILMSTPIIFGGMGIGGLLGDIVGKYVLNKSKGPKIAQLMIIVTLPVLLSGANWVERASTGFARSETITSTILLDATPIQVWDSIKQVDRIEQPLPFLLRIGLPVPISCALEDERVGAERTCYFDSGYIKENITDWDPPRSMKMNITDAQVPGRDWLGFQTASYELRDQGSRTLLIRKTTIVSRLLPAWYWRPLERLGVETEHNYLFEYVRRALLQRSQD